MTGYADVTKTQTEQDGEATRRRSLKPLLGLKPYLRRYKLFLILACVALVVSALATLSVPLAVRRMIDHGFGGADGTLIGQYFAMLIIIGAVLAVASSARFYYVNWLGERVVSDLRADVFAHLTKLGPSFFDRSHSGEVMSRLTADTTQIKAAAGTALSQAARNTIMLIGALIMMMVTSFQLSLLVLVAIPAIVVPLVAYGRVVRRLSRKAQDSLAAASAYAAENLGAVKTMQAFGHETEVAGRYSQEVEASFEAARQRLVARAGLTALAILLVVVSVVGVLWFGASKVVSGELSGGTLGQFVLYAIFAGAALTALSEVWGEISQAAGAAERLTELLAVQPEINSPAQPTPLVTPARGDIAFEGVNFSYAEGGADATLRDISLSISAGENVALVGPSGAGKSTIFSLLLRFYDPSSGLIKVDGVDIKTASLTELRQRMALVPQDTALFADTVAANIRYGTPDATLEAVKRAAIAAQADEFIQALPGGYDAQLGERGVLLSGGQRQRIALARAFLKDAPILLLDEATSALDAESESAIQRALEGIMAGRTTLVIAHRLATVKKADRILVLDEGRIVETGRHRDLIEAGGLYSRLASLQFEGHEAEAAE
ncbi:putative ABC transporter related, fused ATPase and transmembrane permease domains [Candidatus Filomicrobium marinum]|uniref:ATP-binding cassette, subfamily B n=2 Tax=Filomicrobium TaxID=119044 RepID=A0A1H0LRA6_9HYPH|nr:MULTISPECIES: ABC transporter transmembrane domain-containing protein [Filomicrobium]CFW99720.1 putative ABC transporter related, fused ATPase and transmembrane permease domains [Candidatus Filomicrobium marinum]CPR15101.1 putative ABC transporter related, fused ATPase and transmembrane permease domains [Candidatus Filomicrobium marinum]SDO70717.1 ATP-binding cassette, subfamily B [Filomicrobium insigne]